MLKPDSTVLNIKEPSEREIKLRLLEAASRMPYSTGEAVTKVAKTWFDWVFEPPKGVTARAARKPKS